MIPLLISDFFAELIGGPPQSRTSFLSSFLVVHFVIKILSEFTGGIGPHRFFSSEESPVRGSFLRGNHACRDFPAGKENSCRRKI